MTHAALLASTFAATLEQLPGAGPVLLIQDTTSLDFSQHAATQGLGVLENKNMCGFLAHTTLAVSMAPDREGLPLGLVAQAIWARPVAETGTRNKRHTTPFAEKESNKWVTGVAAGSLPAGGEYITVCDREAHIYEFMDRVLHNKLDFIVRATDARSTVLPAADAAGEAGECAPLFAAVANQPVCECATIVLQRRPDRAARTADVEMRFASVTLKRPRRAEAAAPTLTVQVVDIFEPHPPVDSEAVHWLLISSRPVTTTAEAQWVVRAYLCRWQIERLHYILKSGLKLEESQLREFESLGRLLALDSIVAWRLLEMTYRARVTPGIPCTVVLAGDEWQVLYMLRHRTAQLPAQPPTLHEAVGWIAQLGGFLGRKGDGEPGVKVLWRGWTRLSIQIETYHAFRDIHPQKDVGNA